MNIGNYYRFVQILFDCCPFPFYAQFSGILRFCCDLFEIRICMLVCASVTSKYLKEFSRNSAQIKYDYGKFLWNLPYLIWLLHLHFILIFLELSGFGTIYLKSFCEVVKRAGKQLVITRFHKKFLIRSHLIAKYTFYIQFSRILSFFFFSIYFKFMFFVCLCFKYV